MSAPKKPEPTTNYTSIMLLMVFAMAITAMVIIGRSNLTVKHAGTEIGVTSDKAVQAP